MDTPLEPQIDLHFEVLPKQTVKAFQFLSAQKWLSQNGWYLAGGTALALQTGTRTSVDLDFFTTEKEFNVKSLLSEFLDYENWQATLEENNTLYGKLFEAKVSFIAYPFFIPKQDYLQYGTIRLLQPLDIAVMKIVAISQRGKKRDFFDLYWCVHHLERLEQIIKRLPEQYPSVAHDYYHILKSLVYFDDAESDPDLNINFGISWKEVKSFFEKEIPAVMNKLL